MAKVLINPGTSFEQTAAELANIGITLGIRITQKTQQIGIVYVNKIL